MKTASSGLRDFLLTTQAFVRADLYSFALPGGEVLRYASADLAVNANGSTFGLGPLCQDAGVSSRRGVAVSSVDITLYADARHTVNGAPFIDFVEDLGLDGAAIRIERAFAATWADLATTGPVGTYVRFSGRFAEARTLGRTQVVVTASSWLELLSVNLPADVYQTSCLNALGDARCGVDLAAVGVAGTVAGPPSSPPAVANFGSTIGPSQGGFELGKVAFTSGVAAGLARTVKAYDGAGGFTLAAPLPSAPALGDAFVAYPGCDLSMATCRARFDNIARFRGQPFIPVPSTGLPT